VLFNVNRKLLFNITAYICLKALACVLWWCSCWRFNLQKK